MPKSKIIKSWMRKKFEEEPASNLTFDAIETLHSRCIDIPGRQIWFHSVDSLDAGESEEPGIEHTMANRAIKNLHILLSTSRTAPVTIHMELTGGYVSDGFAIYDTIKAMPYPITIINYAGASSMSGYVLQAADKRIMMKNSHYMFHDGSDYNAGTMKQVVSSVEFSKIQDDKCTQIYVEALSKTGKYKNKSQSWIRRKLRSIMDKKEDVYLTAEEAVEWGFADEVLKGF